MAEAPRKNDPPVFLATAREAPLYGPADVRFPVCMCLNPYDCVSKTPSPILAKISGFIYLAAAGMLYGLWRLWKGKEPINIRDSDDHQ